MDMQTICDIFIDAIKLASELLNQDTSLAAGQLDTIIHRSNIVLGIFNELSQTSSFHLRLRTI